MATMSPNVIFMGSPEFALPTLTALVEHTRVVGVVTQPDKPAGRGQMLSQPPVKKLADQYGLPVIQPRRLRDPGVFAQLEAWKPDLIVVAAFGQILRADVLDLPPHGCINVHASLLPRWRGAAPIQAAILHGDLCTGVTIMRMDPGIDTGPILAQREEPIYEQDTALTLSSRLAENGASLLVEILPDYLSGKIRPQPQDESRATYAPMLKKEQGLLDFTQPAVELSRLVRAFIPWPGAHLEWQGQNLRILSAHASPAALPVGQTGVIDKMPAIGTPNGSLVLDKIQPAGKKPMEGREFLNGARGWGK